MRSIEHLAAARARLIRDMERFCLRHRMSETTFGKLALGDTKFASRLRGGQNLTVRTMERADAFMKQAPPRAEQAPPEPAAADG